MKKKSVANLDSIIKQVPTSKERSYSKFNCLSSNNIVSEKKLRQILDEAVSADIYPDALLIERGVPKYEILRCLSKQYQLPCVEFNEKIVIPEDVAVKLDMEKLKREMWVPIKLKGKKAEILVADPQNLRLEKTIKEILHVDQLKKSLALSSDIVRIIEHNQDINPKFPPSAHRTIQAELRTYLADFRTLMSGHRTSMAKGRTGLAMIRTGLSFKTVILIMIKIFGIGYFIVPEVIALCIGMVLFVRGLVWYLPVRKLANKKPTYDSTESTFGSSILKMHKEGAKTTIQRTEPVEGADTLRLGWHRLSPLMKRRFLATDRTDFAEERTALASFRTSMAQGRTGLGFARTGITFIGLGIGLWRQFPYSNARWITFYVSLIFLGTLMTMEGVHWYIPGRKAGKRGLELITKKQKNISIWYFMFNLFHEQLSAGELPATLFLKESHSPGIWGTTGLALERTLIAERRNVKARVRTIMARSRTGMAIIRTGTKVFAVGLGLLVYFGVGNRIWASGEVVLILIGLILIMDGVSWYFFAEKAKNELPYCVSDMEIVMPDYSKPTMLWDKVVLSHDEN